MEESFVKEILSAPITAGAGSDLALDAQTTAALFHAINIRNYASRAPYFFASHRTQNIDCDVQFLHLFLCSGTI